MSVYRLTNCSHSPVLKRHGRCDHVRPSLEYPCRFNPSGEYHAVGDEAAVGLELHGRGLCIVVEILRTDPGVFDAEAASFLATGGRCHSMANFRGDGAPSIVFVLVDGDSKLLNLCASISDRRTPGVRVA